MSVSKQILHQGSVHPGHTGVMDSESVGQQVLQLQVLHLKWKRGDGRRPGVKSTIQVLTHMFRSYRHQFLLFILISNYIYTKTVNKFNLIIFLTLLNTDGKSLEKKLRLICISLRENVYLYFLFIAFSTNFCNIFQVNKFDWLI